MKIHCNVIAFKKYVELKRRGYDPALSCFAEWIANLLNVELTA